MLIYGLDPTTGTLETNGLWPIIMAEMTMLCMANPNENMRFFIFPCAIKAKFYPILLFALFTLMSGFKIQFDVLSGILYGFIHHFILKDKLTLTDNMAKKIEGCFPFNLLKKIKGYVPAASSGLPFSSVAITSSSVGNYTSQNDTSFESSENRNSSANTSQSSSSGGFKAFTGKGVTVGGSLGLNNSEYEGINQNNNN